MRSIIVHITSLMLACPLLAKPLPVREMPKECHQKTSTHAVVKAPAAHTSKDVQRVVPSSQKPAPTAQVSAHISYDSLPLNVKVNYNQAPQPTSIKRVLPGQAQIVHHRPTQVPAIAPKPVALVAQQVAYPAAVQAEMHVTAPVVVYEQPATVVVECQPAARPYVALTPKSMSHNQKYMTLSDGSQWRVRHRDRPLIRHWHNSDLIAIELGGAFSRFNYKLINYSRQQTIEVDRI